MTGKEKYSIGEVSKVCNIPIKTLRYYDETNLVKPMYRNNESNYRYYGREQMLTLFIIRKLRNLGFSIKEIGEMVNENKMDELERSVYNKLSELSERMREVQAQYSEGQAFLNRLQRGVDILSEYDNKILDSEKAERQSIMIEKIPETKLCFTRKTMQRYSNAQVSLERWIEITEKCRNRKIKEKGTILVTYYTKELEQFLFKDCDIEFAMQVEDDESGDDVRKFGGFMAATSIYVGRYGDIMKEHVRMLQWINQNGYVIDGPISEEFIISPIDVINEAEHITKIIVPTKKAVATPIGKEKNKA